LFFEKFKICHPLKEAQARGLTGLLGKRDHPRGISLGVIPFSGLN